MYLCCAYKMTFYIKIDPFDINIFKKKTLDNTTFEARSSYHQKYVIQIIINTYMCNQMCHIKKGEHYMLWFFYFTSIIQYIRYIPPKDF